MFTLFKKEINAFFSSLIGYIVVGVFLILMGLTIWVFPDYSILNANFASLDPLFDFAPMIFLFLIPAVTMRSFSEEKQTGTIELLLTQPLQDWQIILGKFFSSWALVALALLPTLLYYFTVYQLGAPKGNIDTGSVAGSYIGLLLLGGIFVSIGIFVSSLTSNQIVAFIGSVFLCFLVHWGFDFFSRLPIFVGKIDDIIQSFGGLYHYQSISRGVVDSGDVVYFLSVMAFFIFCTQTSMESRKW